MLFYLFIFYNFFLFVPYMQTNVPCALQSLQELIDLSQKYYSEVALPKLVIYYLLNISSLSVWKYYYGGSCFKNLS